MTDANEIAPAMPPPSRGQDDEAVGRAHRGQKHGALRPGAVHDSSPSSSFTRDAKTSRNMAPRRDESQARGLVRAPAEGWPGPKAACLARRGCNGPESPRFPLADSYV